MEIEIKDKFNFNRYSDETGGSGKSLFLKNGTNCQLRESVLAFTI